MRCRRAFTWQAWANWFLPASAARGGALRFPADLSCFRGSLVLLIHVTGGPLASARQAAAPPRDSELFAAPLCTAANSHTPGLAPAACPPHPLPTWGLILLPPAAWQALELQAHLHSASVLLGARGKVGTRPKVLRPECVNAHPLHGNLRGIKV